MAIGDLPYRFFALFFVIVSSFTVAMKGDLRTTKKTDNLASLCTRCRLLIASAILFGSSLLEFSDSSQGYKLRHSIILCFHAKDS